MRQMYSQQQQQQQQYQYYQQQQQLQQYQQQHYSEQQMNKSPYQPAAQRGVPSSGAQGIASDSTSSTELIQSPQTKEGLEHNMKLIASSKSITVRPRTRSVEPSQSPHRPPPVQRPKWTKSSAMMTAEEIDSLLCIQDVQTRSFDTYLEDFYFRNVSSKRPGMWHAS